MEETRLTRYFRTKKVMALLAIGFCWAHKTGKWKQKAIKPLKFKTHGLLEKSIFRYGLDHLTEKLIHEFNDIEDSLCSLIVFCTHRPCLLKESVNWESFGNSSHSFLKNCRVQKIWIQNSIKITPPPLFLF